MKKHLLPLLLVLAMMLAMIAGCGSSSDSSEAEEAASSVEEEAEEEEEPAEEEPAEEAEEEPTEEESAEETSAEESAEEEVMGPEAYYASEETTEISVLFQYQAFFQGFFPEGWGASEFWTEFGDRTNTVWTLREISSMEWSENVNLLCAANDLPDVVCSMGDVYNGGYTAAIRDEMIYDLSDMAEEYAPHYMEYLVRDDYTLRTCLTDDSEMGAIFPLTVEADVYTDGLWIRQDWLDELGMSVPTTTDELEEVLIAFRDNYGADIGMYQMVAPNSNLAAFEVEGVWNAFGPANWYLDEDGQVQFGPMQDWFYDYCAFLKELANEGLFLTSDMTDKSSSDLFASNQIGIEGDSIDNRDSYIILLDPEEQEKINLQPMAALGEPTEYGTLMDYTNTKSAGGAVSISTNCDNPEVVLKALDYLFTDEGMILYTYGIEGYTFEYNSDGEPKLTDIVLNNPDGIPYNAATGYFVSAGIPGLVDLGRNKDTYDETQLSAADIWASAYTGTSGTANISTLSLTQDEQDSISVYLSDMNTYVMEWQNNVVFGDTEINDATIEDFRTTMVNTMHIDDILEVYNAANERFNARSLK